MAGVAQAALLRHVAAHHLVGLRLFYGRMEHPHGVGQQHVVSIDKHDVAPSGFLYATPPGRRYAAVLLVYDADALVFCCHAVAQVA